MTEKQFSGMWELPGIGWLYRDDDHGIQSLAGKPVWQFGLDESRINFEMYPSPDRAIVAAVAAKYTGERGAGGSGVGTAADWFMRMIGADQLVPAENAAHHLAEAMLGVLTHSVHAPSRIIAELEVKGYVLARINES